jgi:tetratricopeptide (TPR) repeat protein
MGKAILQRVLHDPRAGAALVLAAFALVYGRAAGHDFVWDDFPNIVDNPHYAAPLSDSLRSTQHDHLDPTLLTATGLPVAYESYRPLLFLSYKLDDVAFGRSPRAMHIHNLLLGALAVVLAGWIFGQLLPERRAALLATALFALHPLQVEALCYVSARGGLLAAVLALLATGAFWLAVAPAAGLPRRAFSTLTAALAFLASLAAKEAWMSLPLALAALALARGRLRAAAVPLAALCAALCAYLALRVALIGGELSGVDAGVGARALANAPAHALAYLRIFAAPYDLSIERLARTSAVGLALGWIFWTGVTLVTLRGGGARSRVSGAPLRTAAAGLLWFGLLLAPAAVAIETMGVRADRYASLPLFGVALAFGAASAGLWRRLEAGAYLVPGAVGAWALACCIVTAHQVSVWRDNEALYTHSILVEPASALAHYRAGVLAARRHGWPDALEHFERAERLDASNLSVLNNLAVAYLNLGRLDEAEVALQRTLALGGARHFRAWNNLAQVYFARAQRERGCAALERSLAINPAYALARRNHTQVCAADAEPASAVGRSAERAEHG